MAMLRTIPFDEPLATKLAKGPGDGVSLYWLGQAGFVIDAHGERIVIDPYLSDSLAVKYRNAAFSHERMAPAPLLRTVLKNSGSLASFPARAVMDRKSF